MNVSVVIETSFGSLTVNTLPQGMSICKHLALSLVCVTETVLLNLTIEPLERNGISISPFGRRIGHNSIQLACRNSLPAPTKQD